MIAQGEIALCPQLWFAGASGIAPRGVFTLFTILSTHLKNVTQTLPTYKLSFSHKLCGFASHLDWFRTGRYADQLLTVKEVGAILRISEASARNWVNDGRLVGGTIGKMYRIQGESVDVVLRQSRQSEQGG